MIAARRAAVFGVFMFAAVGVAATVGVVLLSRDTHPSVAIGGADFQQESREDLADPVRALWAGRLPQAAR